MFDVMEPGYAPHPVPYLEGWELQREIHRQVASGERPETLILLEHEAVYTAGSRTEDHERPAASATPVIDVDRGGKITWHGPGQLVGYPILRVEERGGIVAIVRRLERLLIDVLAERGVAGRQIEGRSGVWVDQADAPPAKIAAIGMRVAHDVSMHGFALNCTHSLAPYDAIIPCGIRDAGVTTVARETGRALSPREAAACVARAFADAFERIPA
ncbi:lipoyl(octanoyl) transferase LipB [Microbacterium sediminis]|uniref:Octanoyltransferase n=1 Tax=Microbacterium sediminis TaxID=904291 RepID=A0A1B9NFB9_9MICO|nr:lipoyl(octanoyl) transferase LipB [Microbacterium sediminis]OCG75288.1 lipoate--protein ligase B [Microbacterium sediminis]QBR74308.1 lipoyl(octanoyl) transferase LipB [Microbacterium sediminis]